MRKQTKLYISVEAGKGWLVTLEEKKATPRRQSLTLQDDLRFVASIRHKYLKFSCYMYSTVSFPENFRNFKCIFIHEMTGKSELQFHFLIFLKKR